MLVQIWRPVLWFLIHDIIPEKYFAIQFQDQTLTIDGV